MRTCKRCGKPCESNKAWYCDECRDVAIRETRERNNESKRVQRRIENENKVALAKKKKREKAMSSPASKRWASMSWTELSKELLYYGLRYPDAQVMAQNNTLPKDFGLKRKKAKECPQ